MSKERTPAHGLKIWSGQCCLCDIGIPVNALSTFGDPVEIHTGDIIILWHGDFLGTECESWQPWDGLTAVVSNQYQSFGNGAIAVKDEPFHAFPMGILSAGFDSPQWRIQVVKKWSDVVEGEHWKQYGFSYRKSRIADAAREATITRATGGPEQP